MSRDIPLRNSGFGLFGAVPSLSSSVRSHSSSQSSARLTNLNPGSLSMQGSRSLYPASAGPSQSLTPSLVGSSGRSAYASQPHGNLNKAMKLLTNLGLSAEDVDELANILDDKPSVEMLPRLLMQIKAQKSGRITMANNPRVDMSLPEERPYQSLSDSWEDPKSSRVGGAFDEGPSFGHVVDYNFGKSSEEYTGSHKRLDYESRVLCNSSLRNSDSSSSFFESKYTRPSSGPLLSKMDRRKGYPSPRKIEDYHGKMPSSFPHVCSLCDVDVHSTKGWINHVDGTLHAESRQILLDVYPEWVPNRIQDTMLFETTNPAAGILGPAPINPFLMGRPLSGVTTLQGLSGGMSSQVHATKKSSGKVVVAKYKKGACNLKYLMSLAKPFGNVTKHLVLAYKAFLEMRTHEQAQAMVDYYRSPSGKSLCRLDDIYVSTTINTIMNQEETQAQSPGYAVVYFSNLPSEKDVTSDLLEMASQFGPVQNSLIFKSEAFIEMVKASDAATMANYYNLHPATLKGFKIKTNLCKKYKRLRIKPDKDGRRESASSVSLKPREKNQNAVAKERHTRPLLDDFSVAKKRPVDTDTVGSTNSDGVNQESEAEHEEEEDDLELEQCHEDLAQSTEDADMQPKFKKMQDFSEAHSEENKKTTSLPESEEILNESVKIQKEELMETSEDPSVLESSSDLPADVCDQILVPETKTTSETDTPSDNENNDKAEESSEKLSKQKTFQSARGINLPDEEELLEPEDMEDFVTLDEVGDDEDADISGIYSGTKTGSLSRNHDRRQLQNGRVVAVTDFEKKKNIGKEILQLAEPFGTVTNYIVLHDNVALIELSKEEDAIKMVDFYSKKEPVVFGTKVNVHLSKSFKTLANTERVVYLKHLPFTRYTDNAVLKLAKPFGKVRCYIILRNRFEAFIEMETSDDALRMSQELLANPPLLNGRKMEVNLCRKYKRLSRGLKPPSPSPDHEVSSRADNQKEKSKTKEPAGKRVHELTRSPKGISSDDDAGPAVKKLKDIKEEPTSAVVEDLPIQSLECPAIDTEEKFRKENDSCNISMETSNIDECGDINNTKKEENNLDIKISEFIKIEEDTEITTDEKADFSGPECTLETLGPYQPSQPVGVEYVIPKTGYFCRLCSLFYSNEEMAKTTHCSTLGHYSKVKEMLQKSKAAEK
ncbi:matrin-3-like isoform X2 [Erpetoichthys calabaricus]|uniref:matrin-3-like isoform X2 n=1 Tax=Erpetoichthys calabaricus TaxID=27687 RepID=UPI00109FB419|nr:matrin-3-like isoform X2 [Erpetoichthys calabaricus]